MATAVPDLFADLAKRSDEELKSLAAKAIRQLMDRHPDDVEPLQVRSDDNPVVYLVYPIRPGYTLKTTEERTAEAERRARLPNRRLRRWRSPDWCCHPL